MSLVEFGVKTGPGGYSLNELVSIWTEAEKLGFDSGWLYDHLYSLSKKEEVCVECWTTLTYLASLTKRMKIGSMVLCNQFRHPALLAKMSATLDVISYGRLQLGMGAGWYDEESMEMGVEFPSAGTRIERLKESVQIIKLLWASEKASFKGKHYLVQNGICNPKPIQRPGPPVWIGIIKGTNVMPKVAAEVADGVNLTFIPPEECRRRMELVKAACRKLNRPTDQIHFSLQGRILIASDVAKLNAKIETFAKKAGMTPMEYRKELESEAGVIGTPDVCSKKLQAYVDIGIEHFMLVFLGDRTLEPLRVFADKVMPELR
jgi:alkanesulfonate monooxygenase SsuD/methylene tetrahydromethanopterin reductase-like flavin-dependent oxidoreductase (luciferase family)